MDVTYWISNNYIELFGAVTGIIYVFLEIRQTIWLWPLGIVTSALYIIVFFTSKFYADAGLQVYYLVISVFGWYWWVKGERRAESGKRERSPGQEKKSVEPSFAEATDVEAGGLELAETGPLPGGAWGGFKEESIGRRAERVEKGLELAETDPLPGGAWGGLNIGIENSDIKQELPVTRVNLNTALILSVVFAALFAVMWYILDNFTDSPVPGWDSFLTALSVIATWMLARKILEHWILWIVVDVVSMFVYMSRALYPTVVLFAVYSIMAVIGYFEWKKKEAKAGLINTKES